MQDKLIAAKATEAIANNVFPGCVVGYVKKNGERQILPFGRFTYDQSSESVAVDTLYDVASLTKAIPTASIALQLLDEGKLHLDDLLIQYVPEFNNSDRNSVRIKHLLTYTLDGYGLARVTDGGSGSALHEKTAADLLHVLLTHDFEKRPGTVFTYSNIPAALLGLVIESVTGSTLDTLAEERFFTPLGMERSTFYPERFPLSEVVPTEIDQWRGEVRGVVHDESAYLCKKEGKVVGHAGLFSTAPDILRFMEMLLNNGSFNGVRYFSESVMEQIQTNQIPELNDSTGLGWELHQPRYMGKHATLHTFGKTGFTGTLCICDIQKEIAYVILSNRIFPQRPKDSAAINAFRAAIGELLLGGDSTSGS